MERKIDAKIEFQAKGQCQNSQLGNNCGYLPSEVIECFYEYPLKFIIPSSITDGCCQWVYPITFGGGLLEGDHLKITFTVGQKCCILITTMSFPKTHCCENGGQCQQLTEYSIGSKALLCVLLDPLVCFKNSCYYQSQTFHLSSDSNLVLLDWFTSGRYSRGERWAFSRLRSVSTIFINGKLEFRESQNIQSTPFVDLESSMKSYNIVGTCMVIGPQLEFLYSSVLTELGRCRRYGEKPNPDLLFAVSPLCGNGASKHCGCIIRFAAVSVHNAIRRIEELLQPLFSILGENPFANK